MSEDNPKHFRSIKEWHDWLSENYTNEEAIWLIIQKKSSKKPGIRYEGAVVEAVAFGWIDGKLKRLNDNEFMQRFVPRRRNSVWSQSNRERADRLISEGKMALVGLNKFEKARENGHWDKKYSSRSGAVNVPDDLIVALRKNKTAHDNFESFPPSVRFMYIYWINEAKRQDTRKRRIYTVIDRSEKNLRPGSISE